MWPGCAETKLHIGSRHQRRPLPVVSNLRRLYARFPQGRFEGPRMATSPSGRVCKDRRRGAVERAHDTEGASDKPYANSTAIPSRCASTRRARWCRSSKHPSRRADDRFRARRFATNKRAYLLFTNLERLSAIVNNKEHPVQFIFAGKAHPNDKPGQDLIKRIIEVSSMPEVRWQDRLPAELRHGARAPHGAGV